VGDSLAEDFVGIIGDGTFVPSRAAYLKLFKQHLDDKKGLRYERVTDRVEVSSSAPLAAEHGHWIATHPDGTVAFTGSYMAMWRHESEVWKIRSETYVTLTGAD
jgi:hypothetical protein